MTTKIATSILAKRRRVKAAQGQSYASNPGGTTPSASAPASSSAGNSGGGSGGLGSTLWNYGGKQILGGLGNTFGGLSTTARGLANTAAGTIGATLGAPIGGVATAGGYLTDAVGLTTNAGPANFAGTQAYLDEMGRAVGAGLQDSLGGAVDTLSLGNYDYDGTFADPATHAGTAVQQLNNRHRQILGDNNAYRTAYEVATGTGNIAADLAAPVAAGRAINVGAKAIAASQIAAPTLTAIGSAPVVGRPLAAAGNWLAGSAPNANMFQQGAREYYANSGVLNLADDTVNAIDGISEAVENAGVEVTPKPDEFASTIVPKTAPPEVLDQVTTATQTLQESITPEQRQSVGEAINDPNSAAGQEYAQRGFEKFQEENAETAPQSPTDYGAWVNGLVDQFQQMDPMMQIGLGLGLGTAVLGLIGSVTGGGIGSFLLGALGLGAAGATGAAGGLFGETGSDFATNAIYNMGTASGMIPESADLSMLKGEDALERLLNDNKAIGSREDMAKRLAGYEDQLANLEKLVKAPLSDTLKIGLMRKLDASITSVEDAQQRLANANKIYAALQDPKSGFNKKLQDARGYAESDGISGWLAEQGAGWSDWWNKRSSLSPRKPVGFYAKRILRHNLDKQAGGRCWSGYEPVPGKKPYTAGSCRPIGKKKKKAKKPK